MRRVGIVGLVVASLAVALAVPARSGRDAARAETAGFAGTLVPRFVFSGAVDSGEGVPDTGTAATSVHCTNFGSVGSLVELTVRDWDGTEYSGVLFASPSRTVTYSTHQTAIFANEFNLDTPSIDQGSGIISAERHEVLCSALVLDPSAARPAFMSRLPLHALSVPGEEIFADGFESGGTGAWDVTVD